MSKTSNRFTWDHKDDVVVYRNKRAWKESAKSSGSKIIKPSRGSTGRGKKRK